MKFYTGKQKGNVEKRREERWEEGREARVKNK